MSEIKALAELAYDKEQHIGSQKAPSPCMLTWWKGAFRWAFFKGTNPFYEGPTIIITS
jgi:hypothetical protein